MNLVMGVAVNYDWNQIKPFIVSLRKYYKDDVVLFISSNANEEMMEKLKQYKIKTIIHDMQGIYKIVKMRYFLYKDYLQKNKYDKVIITGARDVLFQKEPFEFDEGLHFFEEDSRMTIGKCPYNSSWIREIFGEELLKKYTDKFIYNADVSMGTYKDIVIYIDLMCKYFNKFSSKKIIDQGLHNYLIYEKLIDNFTTYKNEEGIVITIGYMLPDKIRFKDGQVLNKKGVPAIIHQYDRYPQLFNEKWRLK
ncbi:hypothetical protein KAI04_03890 [Candidatus Pacearchaeota archaeon]|nr:hypothetical protein [Candidatus Pacearchaeota archaeon]